MNNKFRQIYRKIKKYNKIVIARHVGPDPDCLSSQIALRDIILDTFPEKKVYAVGCPTSAFKYLGVLDKFDEELYKDALLIVVDTPDKKRVDGVDPEGFKDSIKIDHHPFIEQFCKLELIDDTASSAAQLIIELVNSTRLKMTKESAEKLFIGIVADTNRFLFNYTTPKTFKLVSQLIERHQINFTKLYEQLYMRPLKEIKFQGYLAQNLKVTEHGFAYIKLPKKVLDKLEVDVATAGNSVNEFNYINEIVAWGMFSEDTNNNQIRGTIRSRGPVINEAVAEFGGGGHIFASGVRLKSFDEVDQLVEKLDDVCKAYLKTE